MSAKHQPRIALTNRIIFPIINEHHRVIGFSGRSLRDQDIKYLNTPETTLFQKKNVFYNETIFSEPLPYLIIVEGYLDVIALHQAQITNSIALMGTNLSQQHIKKIKEQHLNVVLWLDPDIAGINAMLKSSINLIKNNIKVKIYHNSAHKIDPAGLLQKININSQSLKSFLISPLNFALLVYQQQYQKNPKREQAINELMKNIKPFIKAENNPLQQNNAIEQLAKTIQQPSKLIKEYLQLAATRATTISQHKNTDIMMTAQQKLIWNVFNNQKNFFYFQKNIKD